MFGEKHTKYKVYFYKDLCRFKKVAMRVFYIKWLM